MRIGYSKFMVGEACYLYDTATNAIVGISAAVYAILEDYLRAGRRGVVRKFAGRLPAEDLDQAVDFLQACRARRMLQPMRRVNYLAITSAPNLRRQYRQGLKRMTLGITERCNQRCRYCPFGGAGNAAPRRVDVEIVLCTNATLLDRPMLEFLMANKVVLQISLDGPAQVHDKARVLAGSGPTHAAVLRVLNWIRRRKPAYYRTYVRPHCTFGLEDDLLEVLGYFNRSMFQGLRIRFGYRTGAFRVSEAERIRHEAQLDDLIEQHLSGSGALHPCEGFAQAASRVGRCEGGIDIRKPQRLMQPYARLCDRICQGCWAWRLCSHCYLQSRGPDGRISSSPKQRACQREIGRIAQRLRRYVYVWQNEPAWAAKIRGTLHHSKTHQP